MAAAVVPEKDDVCSFSTGQQVTLVSQDGEPLAHAGIIDDEPDASIIGIILF